MHSSPSLRPVLIGGIASLVAGLIFAMTVGGTASLIFLGLGPLMAGVAVTDRLLERRSGIRIHKAELVSKWSRLLSPQQFLEAEPRPLTWWQLGLPAPQTRRIRVGRVSAPWREVIPGSGRALCQRVIQIDPQGGLEVRGNPEVTRAVAGALRLAVAREYSPEEARPTVVEGSGQSDQPIVRWVLDVTPRGVARLSDCLGLENPVDVIEVDLLRDVEMSETAAFERRHSSYSLSEIDVVADGPHALVSGVTGSGKTEMLVAWLADHARRYPRDELAIAVVDFKGGGSFSRLRGVPHLRHLVTDLDELGLLAAEEGLAGQIRSRERAMARHGVASIQQIPEDRRPSRVVLVVDEFRTLIRLRPAWKELLTDLAARGRALGIHLVLATQRFGSLSADELTSNIGLRVVCRPADQAESQLLLGSSIAWDHGLKPGQAFVVTANAPARMLEFAMWQSTTATEPPTEHGSPLWCEPAGQRPTPEEFAMPKGFVLLGTRADHEALKHVPVWWSPEHEGLLLAIGADRRARIDLAALTTRFAPCILHLPAEPGLAWDALEIASAEPEALAGLAAPELDVCVARVPPGWREEFSDRLMGLIHSLIARGAPVMLGFTSESSLSARIMQNAHSLVEAAGPEAIAHFKGHRVVLAEVAPAQSAAATIPDLCLTDGDCIVITARKGFWRNHLSDDVRAVSVDEYLAQAFVSPVDLCVTRLVIDDVSPAEFRAMRVSSRTLPPPHPRTVLELLPDGRLVRRDISGLENGANFTDGTATTKNVKVQLTRDQVDVRK